VSNLFPLFPFLGIFFSSIFSEKETKGGRESREGKQETQAQRKEKKIASTCLDVDKGKFALCKNCVGKEQFPLSFSGRLRVCFD